MTTILASLVGFSPAAEYAVSPRWEPLVAPSESVATGALGGPPSSPPSTVGQADRGTADLRFEGPLERLPGSAATDIFAEGAGPRVVLDPAPPEWHRRAWCWEVVPEGLLYPSYLAGVKEPRFGAVFAYEEEQGWIWDIALGGRVGLVRYGTHGPLGAEGWQFDLEGGALPRLDYGEKMDLVACDYRFGFPLTYARGQHRTKFGYYHVSSHLGDEWMIRYPALARINYVRETLVLGHMIDLTPKVRVYAEAAWAWHTDGGSKPWEFQFGAEYSAREPSGRRATPFLAINGHLREEVDFGGGLTLQTGLQWRGRTGHLFRTGIQYYNGMSDQFEFYGLHESKVGVGVWYDY